MAKRRDAIGPKVLLERFSDYLGSCDASGWKPTWEGFAGYLGRSSAFLLGLLRAKEGDALFSPEMSEAMQLVQDALVNRLLQRSDTMAVFSLKQPRYGGYADKPALPGGESLKIEFTLRGMDAPPPKQG